MNAKPSDEAQQSLSKWQERIQALNNVPPLFRMVWESAPKPVGANVACRIMAGLVPLAMLRVTQAVIDCPLRFEISRYGIAGLLLVVDCTGICFGRRGDSVGPRHRLLRQRDRRQVHPAHRHENHGARVES